MTFWSKPYGTALFLLGSVPYKLLSSLGCPQDYAHAPAKA